MLCGIVWLWSCKVVCNEKGCDDLSDLRQAAVEHMRKTTTMDDPGAETMRQLWIICSDIGNHQHEFDPLSSIFELGISGEDGVSALVVRLCRPNPILTRAHATATAPQTPCLYLLVCFLK